MMVARVNTLLRVVLAVGIVGGTPVWCANATPGSEVQALLRDGHLDSALERVQKALESAPSNPDLLCLLGDILYRHAQFDAAEQAYTTALESAPEFARAHWGLGRISKLHFDRRSAVRYFAKAFRLDPQDSEVILAYADATFDSETRKRLWLRYLNLAGEDDPARTSDIRARLAIEERIGNRPLSALASPYRSYRFSMTRFFAAGPVPDGLLLTVRIGENKPLRLVFDTGGSGVIVNSAALRGADLEFLADASIAGIGSGPPMAARVALAPSLAIGDLVLNNVALQVVDRKIVRGADGVIGADVFREFLVTLDGKSRTLELTPLQGVMETEAASIQMPAYSISHLLLVRATLDGVREGYYLLDTGSANSVISKNVEVSVSGSVPLWGAQGEVAGAHRIQPVNLKLAGAQWVDPTPISADLSRFSDHHGVEIAGTIGYSLLARSVLTINYRDGWVQISGSR